jgi:methylated-DNA-[protein]-cysteine S-methyltransferase
MMKKLSYLHTKRGILASAWSEQGLYELTFPYPTATQAQEHLTRSGKLDEDLNQQQRAWRKKLEAELEVYFTGRPIIFTTPVDWTGYSEFRRKALQFTAAIPSGQVSSYGGVAMAIGSPGAARAIGGAMHANRTPIIVPCHRVVGSDGSLTGFGGGLAVKQELLALEKND